MMTIFQMENTLREGGRVTILMRHAERPPLDPGDTTFGAMLPITERGCRTATRFGMMLSHIVLPEQVRAYASSTLRTVQTARCILEGLCSDTNPSLCPTVQTEGFLGSDSPFFGSLDERMALIAEGHYRERLNDYFSVGVQRGYRPLVEATERMEGCLRTLYAPRGSLVVAVTHDVNVGCFLAGRKVITSFTEETWPYYLDAAVILDCEGQPVQYGVLRWDRSFDGFDT